jgi:translation initiation factor IF-3
MSTSEALSRAREKGLDLVLVAPDLKAPVCRIADYGKMRYEIKKKERQSQKQRTGILKELKVRPKIGEHDLVVRINQAKEFLGKKFRVKVTLTFRGREATHPELGRKILQRIIEEVSSVGIPEASPKRDGKLLLLMLIPK